MVPITDEYQFFISTRICLKNYMAVVFRFNTTNGDGVFVLFQAISFQDLIFLCLRDMPVNMVASIGDT